MERKKAKLKSVKGGSQREGVVFMEGEIGEGGGREAGRKRLLFHY